MRRPWEAMLGRQTVGDCAYGDAGLRRDQPHQPVMGFEPVEDEATAMEIDHHGRAGALRRL